MCKSTLKELKKGKNEILPNEKMKSISAGSLSISGDSNWCEICYPACCSQIAHDLAEGKKN
ncbi:hypothetical protein TOREUM_31111 [Tenacibaculum litoreum]|uniref:hypothetical protein n=1 Tax=Tenacibaculum litoreum TaxID=321269 RepID=UPI003893DCE3